MRPFNPLAAVLFLLMLLAVAAPSACAQAQDVQPQLSAASRPAKPVTTDQIREYLKLTQFGEIWRSGWIKAMDENKGKGAPYWPESFWGDLKKHMEAVDLVPMIAGLYKNHVSADDMQEANEDLHKMSIAEFAATPFGSHFCHETQLSGPENEAATLALTQIVFQQVYDDHRAEINNARAKYLAEHPGYVDPT